MPEYSLAKFKNVMLPMRDGVRLATDIYRPARMACWARDVSDDPVPHVVRQERAALRGHRGLLHAARVHRRAPGPARALRLEGTGQYFHVVNVNEGNDGYDTVEWIAAQPWSNGRVGMVGSSHPGLTQTLAALHRPPHLTAIWPDVVPINSYLHQARRGGAMCLQMFGALFVHAMDAQEFRANPAGKQVIIDAMEHLRDLVYATPFKPGQTPLSVVPNLEETLINYYTRGAYDEYWALEPNDFTRISGRHADIPVMLTGGWFDLFADATPVYYARMRAEQGAGPAPHGTVDAHADAQRYLVRG